MIILIRPWILSLWFALEPGCILQPPTENQGIDMIDFPLKDIDYSKLDEEVLNLNRNNNNENFINDGLERLQAEDVNITTNNINNNDRNRQIQTFENKRDSLDSKKNNGSNSLTKQERDDLKTASYILIESNDILNINVTPSAYKVILVKINF